MMRTTWMKLFVASLMLLGDYAYSSEFDNRFDFDVAASDNSIPSYQSVTLDDDGTQWVPSQASENAIPPHLRFVPQTNKVVMSRFPETTRKYRSLNPRAPPEQAG
jgi:hypothetical protein